MREAGYAISSTARGLYNLLRSLRGVQPKASPRLNAREYKHANPPQSGASGTCGEYREARQAHGGGFDCVWQLVSRILSYSRGLRRANGAAISLVPRLLSGSSGSPAQLSAPDPNLFQYRILAAAPVRPCTPQGFSRFTLTLRPSSPSLSHPQAAKGGRSDPFGSKRLCSHLYGFPRRLLAAAFHAPLSPPYKDRVADEARAAHEGVRTFLPAPSRGAAA